MRMSRFFHRALPLLLLPAAGAVQAQAQDEAPLPQSEGAAPAGRLVTVTFDLDTDGVVTACKVTASSGIKELDDMSCQLVRDQGKYEQVLDEDGKAVPASIIQTLTWHPEEAPQTRQLADMGPVESGQP